MLRKIVAALIPSWPVWAVLAALLAIVVFLAVDSARAPVAYIGQRTPDGKVVQLLPGAVVVEDYRRGDTFTLHDDEFAIYLRTGRAGMMKDPEWRKLTVERARGLP